jgi:branched-chain amino acid transport system substrate-binding protein
MRARGRWAFATAGLLALVLIGSALAATVGHRAAQAKAPIIIGWAFDGTGNMAPFDGPALAAAKLRVNQVNAKGGVNGRKLEIRTCDTQGNDAVTAKPARPLCGAAESAP